MNKPKVRVVADYTHALAVHGQGVFVASIVNPTTSSEVVGFNLFFIKRTGEILALK
jgi:hypothetical protein